MHHEGNESELYEMNKLASGSPALNRTLPEAEPDPLNSTEVAAPPSHTELPPLDTSVLAPALSLLLLCSLVSLHRCRSLKIIGEGWHRNSERWTPETLR